MIGRIHLYSLQSFGFHMNEAAPLLPKPIPPRVLKFLGEWLSSTVTLFIDPTNALRVYNTNPQIVAGVNRDIAFSGSCLFLSSSIYLLVLVRSENVSWMKYSSQVTSMALLILAFWAIYAMINAAAIGALGGTVDPRTNTSFGVRTLATFYLVATIISTMAFLASGKQRLVFDLTTIILRIVLPLVIMPMLFWKPNGLKGRKVGLLYLVIVLLAVGNATIDSLILFPPAPHVGPLPLPLPQIIAH
jgi:hypothetical protein